MTGRSFNSVMSSMLFQNKLYFIESSEKTPESARYVVSLNAEHAIYQAHFPGEPITPGVCILQMALELLCDALSCDLEISCAKNVKFLNILRPDGEKVEVHIGKMENADDSVKAQIVFNKNEMPIAKMSLICLRTAKQD